jgi:hypothetical protein
MKENALEEDREERTLEDVFDLLSVGSHFQWTSESHSAKKNTRFDHLLFGFVFLLQRCRWDVGVKIKKSKRGKEEEKTMTMGEKLKLCEEVERGIGELGCPLPLRAHQICGLDSEKVFPVVQWLTKRAMVLAGEKVVVKEDKEGEWERGDGGSLFGKTRRQSGRIRRSRLQSLFLCESVTKNNTRTFRRAAESNANRDLEREGEEKIRNGCLMEFGHRVNGKSRLYDARGGGSSMMARAAAKNRGEEKKDGGSTTMTAEEEDAVLSEEELAQREEAKLKRMLSEYLVKNDENDENASNVSSNSVAELLVKMKGWEIAKAMNAFGDDFDTSDGGSGGGASTSFAGLSGAAGKILRIERSTRAVARRLEAEKRKLDSKREEMDEAELETKRAKDAYENARKENETVIAKRVELEKSVTDPAQKQLVDALANMARRRASLKKEEALFRKTCKKELKVLKAKVTSIEEEREQTGELAKIAETSAQYAKEKEKRDKRVNELAKRSKKNAILSRRLDDVPHSAELAQYETRFRELKNAVTRKLRETKRQFALYNSLAKRSEHAAKEISLLTSVKEQLHLLDTKIGKESLRDSLRDISSAVSKTADNAERKKMNEKRAEELLAEDQREHIEKRKEYLKLTKEFKDLCKREERCLRSSEEGKEEEENTNTNRQRSGSSSRSSSDDDSGRSRRSRSRSSNRSDDDE